MDTDITTYTDITDITEKATGSLTKEAMPATAVYGLSVVSVVSVSHGRLFS